MEISNSPGLAVLIRLAGDVDRLKGQRDLDELLLLGHVGSPPRSRYAFHCRLTLIVLNGSSPTSSKARLT